MFCAGLTQEDLRPLVNLDQRIPKHEYLHKDLKPDLKP